MRSSQDQWSRSTATGADHERTVSLRVLFAAVGVGILYVVDVAAMPDCGNGPVDPAESADYHRSGAYRAYFSPYPLSEKDFLVSAERNGKFLLYLMDVEGNRELIYEGVNNIFHAMPLKENQVWMYRYDLAFSGVQEPEVARRVMLFSDRNVYRTGEEVHLEALVREWGEQGLAVPTNLTGTVVCGDARGRQFFQTNATFSAAGGCSVSIRLPEGVRGEYAAGLRLGTNTYPYSFLVQDFQPNAFEISLQSKTAYAADEPIAVPVSAKYLFGKTLSRAQVNWWLHVEDTDFRPEPFAGFNFRRFDPESRFGRGGPSISLNGQGTLSGSNNLVIAPDLPVNNTVPQPRSASLLVEVTDLNQQTLSRRVEFLRHSSDFYLGLRQEAKVLKAGEVLPLELVAVAERLADPLEALRPHAHQLAAGEHPLGVLAAGQRRAALAGHGADQFGLVSAGIDVRRSLQDFSDRRGSCQGETR